MKLPKVRRNLSCIICNYTFRLVRSQIDGSREPWYTIPIEPKGESPMEAIKLAGLQPASVFDYF